MQGHAVHDDEISRSQRVDFVPDQIIALPVMEIKDFVIGMGLKLRDDSPAGTGTGSICGLADSVSKSRPFRFLAIDSIRPAIACG
jgi:hypothetical protein